MFRKTLTQSAANLHIAFKCVIFIQLRRDRKFQTTIETLLAFKSISDFQLNELSFYSFHDEHDFTYMSSSYPSCLPLLFYAREDIGILLAHACTFLTQAVGELIYKIWF